MSSKSTLTDISSTVTGSGVMTKVVSGEAALSTETCCSTSTLPDFIRNGVTGFFSNVALVCVSGVWSLCFGGSITILPSDVIPQFSL